MSTVLKIFKEFFFKGTFGKYIFGKKHQLISRFAESDQKSYRTIKIA